MTNETTPEPLTLVGWYCWRCEGLNAQACRSDAVPVHVPAEWADDMRREIARLEEEDDEQEAAAAYGRALDTPPSDQAAAYMRERLASDNPPRRTSQPEAPDGASYQYAARAFNAVGPALKKIDQWMPLSARKVVAEAILAELKPELARLAEYENTINWMTTCTSCAQVLDSSIRETERAVKAEAEVEAHRLALSQALGLGTGAPWNAIRDRAAELHRKVEGGDAQQGGAGLMQRATEATVRPGAQLEQTGGSR